MPELPEVENIVQYLYPRIVGQEILYTKTFYPKIRYPIPEDFASLANVVILDLSRRGKYIIMSLTKEQFIVIHLGMAGIISLSSDFNRTKYTRYAMHFNNDLIFQYDDHRGFGILDLLTPSSLSKYKAITKMGPEPFSDEFNADYLYKKAQSCSCNIKNFLLNQEIVAGIGNIYACETMYRTKINPQSIAKQIPFELITNLVSEIRYVLKLAIKFGGSSIDFTYRHPDGTRGQYHELLLVYNNEGRPCLECNTKICRINQGGRSTYYCPNCQIL